MKRKIKLSQNNYYSVEADSQYFSVSQYKDFMKCEAMAMAKIRGGIQTRDDTCHADRFFCGFLF